MKVNVYVLLKFHLNLRTSLMYNKMTVKKENLKQQLITLIIMIIWFKLNKITDDRHHLQ